jgi:hypothetical protein
VNARLRLAIAAGDVASGVGSIAGDPKSLVAEHRLDALYDLGRAAAPEPVAEGEVDQSLGRPIGREPWHRMAVQEQNGAKRFLSPAQQSLQRLVVRPVGQTNAPLRLEEVQSRAIDRLAADPARDSA